MPLLLVSARSEIVNFSCSFVCSKVSFVNYSFQRRSVITIVTVGIRAEVTTQADYVILYSSRSSCLQKSQALNSLRPDPFWDVFCRLQIIKYFSHNNVNHPHVSYITMKDTKQGF